MRTLSKRARSVLYAVVTEFTATGEPVGSRTLTKKYGFDLSAATIRNVLSDLEDAGYLTQPHTSAGRVPTEAAFRLFIDALMRVRRLSNDEIAKIDEHLDDLPPGADMMRETGRLLSRMTGAVGVVARSRIEARSIQKLRFVPTCPGEVLVVLVFAGGTVENRFIGVDGPLSERELERLHNMLEDVIEGQTLPVLRDELVRLAERERDELKALLNLGHSMVAAALTNPSRGSDIVIEGQARLLDLPEFADGDRVRNLMSALDEREKLVLLLDRTLASENVQVFLGEETSEAVGYPVTVVAAPFLDNGRPGGSLGIVGPTRMDYPGIVPLVGRTAEAVSAALARGGRSEDPSAEGERDD